ncbi:MAG: error-prone DNA polymerase [Verrucomicrobia bacterium]|nr:MAG: error-prone DNA polymerase [Verrucomicrobiota bacterium]
MTSHYVELHARSAFSWLRGASTPEAMVTRASELDLSAIALCDRDGLYGSVRQYQTAQEKGLQAILGAELTLEDGTILPVLVRTAKGYAKLSHLLTTAKLRGTKTQCHVTWQELAKMGSDWTVLTGDEEGPLIPHLIRNNYAAAQAVITRLIRTFGRANVCVEIQRHLRRGDERRTRLLLQLAEEMRLLPVATSGAAYATAQSRELSDVLSCIRHHIHLDAAGRLLDVNAERYLKPKTTLSRLFGDCPEVLENTLRVADRIEFSLQNLNYQFPRYQNLSDEEMAVTLREVTFLGARNRYANLSERVIRQLNHELNIIIKLGFSGYFLIVWDLVNFCRESNIFMQGRGSAANSAVCYSLGITACDPIKYDLLFERFLSEGRTTWPDIDLDLPSGKRRETVIQEVYRRYGEHGVAMMANVITFRGHSALREIGKALNFPPEILDRLSKMITYEENGDLQAKMEQVGLSLGNPRVQAIVRLYSQIYGLPRHLGQHSGGMILCQDSLSSIVPLERASMPGRIVAQWDKDDCADLGIIKIDLLGLGMMAVLQDTLELCHQRGHPIDLAKLPERDPKTFDIMCRAETIGMFQIESRAQMAILPRMKPHRFYDIAIQIALIRPGPIQGNIVKSFLARRAGKEKISYFDERLKPILERTLGVPLFQEQLLKIAMVMAHFSASDAEELRRALGFYRSPERMESVCTKLRLAMEQNGIPPKIITEIEQAFRAFAVYGFPESHAISFALLTYASGYLKVHHGPEFYVSLLNNQPMGFYSPATLVQEAKRQGIRVHPVSIFHSEWLSTIESDNSIRLGFCIVKGLTRDEGNRILSERGTAKFESIAHFKQRVQINPKAIRTLARIGALNGLVQNRRDGLWRVEFPSRKGDFFDDESTVQLPTMTAFERLAADYSGTGLTTGAHPMQLVREHFPDVWRASDLSQARNGAQIKIAGLVICRQRPGTAKGFVFISLEDETGIANATVSPDLFKQRRFCITQERFLCIQGIVQINENVISVKAEQVESLFTTQIPLPRSYDFH